VRITLSPLCAGVMKSGNLNSLEPSGPLQGWKGTALPLPFTFYYKMIHFYGVVFRSVLNLGVELPEDDVNDVETCSSDVQLYLYIPNLLLLASLTNSLIHSKHMECVMSKWREMFKKGCARQ